jgi:hypothetical protein
MTDIEDKLPAWFGHLRGGLSFGQPDSTPRPRLTIMQSAKPRKARKPNIKSMIKQAEQAEKVVASITTPDGFTITFDPKDDKSIQTADDELAQWRKRKQNANSG